MTLLKVLKNELLGKKIVSSSYPQLINKIVNQIYIDEHEPLCRIEVQGEGELPFYITVGFNDWGFEVESS